MRILLSILLTMTVHAQDPKNYCPGSPMDTEYFVANNTCYLLSGTTGTNPLWTFAHNDCKRTKGSLLIFKDKSNEDAVVSHITLNTGFDSNFYWLDINRAGDSWKWATGAALTYTPSWDTGTGDCAVINVEFKTWSPRDCSVGDWSTGYICQYDSTSSSSRVTQDAVIVLTLVLTLYRIFVTDR